MFKTFILSFKLRNTYKVNTIIYAIKQLPIIRKILPNSLYQNRGIKIFANIISAILEIISIFIWKLVYILLMLVAPLSLYKTNMINNFFNIMLFLTIGGAFMNTYMFNPTKDKYYAMFLMRMNAKQYTLSNYWYSILKVIIGFMPFIIIFGRMAGVNLLSCIIMPFFIASAKILVGAYNLKSYEKNNIVVNENTPVKFVWGIVFTCLILAYLLPYLGLSITPFIFTVIALISIIGAIFGIIFINKFDKYREMYKKILTSSSMNTQKNAEKIARETVLNQIEITPETTSNKKGYAYFNEIFIKRHSKILSKSVKWLSYIIIFIIIGMIFFTQINEELRTKTNEMLMSSLPYFVFIMYLINRGQTVTQSMFMNCDHSMLTYAFFRSPKAILSLFKERIKSVVFINAIPAILVGIGLSLLLYFTGGTTNNLDYLIIFVSIISMSVFFSIHHLVMYYLLQPYNAASETKSSTYSVVNLLTYFVCYYMMKVKLPTTYFGIATIIFASVYCIISLILAYRLAPKTFKLRV